MPGLLISSSNSTAVVEPENGGRVASLSVNGTELIVGPEEGRGAFDWGIYPMAPFAGRLRDGKIRYKGTVRQMPLNAEPHAMHGFVHDTEWRIHDKTESSVTLRCELGDPWPWRGNLFHIISVHDWKLRMELSFAARNEQPMMLGWHPWFPKPCTFTTEFGTMYERGDDGIPTGRLVRPRTHDVDDCFADPLDDPTVTVGDTRVKLFSNCSHWVVYDRAEHGVCIEPQSGPPNGANDSPFVVRAGSEMRRWFEIRW